MKNRKLNQWLWKWHVIAGVIAVPFVLVLSITGAIYLFKDQVEVEHLEQISTVAAKKDMKSLSFQQQLEKAQATIKKPINQVVLPTSEHEATAFAVGRFSHKKTIFVDPYTANVTGKFSPKDTWMYTVRKLHGELLGGKVGTKFVELVACWTVVLVLTGLYVWFPFKRGNIKGAFSIRLNAGRRTFFRDLHAVSGFWLSVILLLTIAGGLPWTDVFGGGFKKIRDLTQSGYPATWQGRGLVSTISGEKISLDEMVDIAKAQNLKGVVTISLPKGEKGTFGVSNTNYTQLDEQKMLRFDQYSGQLIKAHNWSDVGLMTRGRMWVMAFHQGQLAAWNWWMMFIFSILLAIMSIAGIASYLIRKPSSGWGIPAVPEQFQIDKILIGLIVFLAILFPLFGASVLLIWLIDRYKNKVSRT